MKAEYVDHMGDDISVVNAARVSMDNSSDFDEQGILNCSDEKLIKYLSSHNHWTPFAHTAITLRMSAPIPIRTQCFKHKVGFSENEESRRYISSIPDVFVPDNFRMASDSVKQGSGGVHDKSDYWIDLYKSSTTIAIHNYNAMISDGVCPEQARLVLPQGCEVNWIWTGNLASYARFYNQRTDPNSQKEVATLAKCVSDIISPLFNVSWSAMTNRVCS